MYKIYKITNKVNGLIYIGCTGQNLKTRFHGTYNQRLTEAIKEYGYDNFTIEAIEKTEDILEAKRLESKYIQELDATNEQVGYNKADKSAYYSTNVSETKTSVLYCADLEEKKHLQLEQIKYRANKKMAEINGTVSKTEIVEPKPQKTHIIPQIVKDALAGLGFPAREECTAEEQKYLYNETFLALYQAYNKITDETKRAEILKQIEELF